MGFLDFFRPKWRHSDLDTRAQAVRDLPDDDTVTLTQIATGDPDVRVRRIAVKKLYDPAALRKIAEAEQDESLREAAGDKAAQLLVDAALGKSETGGDTLDPLQAVALLEDARSLARVVQRAQRDDVGRAALHKLRDFKLLSEVALKAEEPAVRLMAVAKINDQTLLAAVARESDHKGVAMEALGRVNDPTALAAVAKNGRIKAVRQAAQARLPKADDAEAAGEDAQRSGAARTAAPARAAGPNPAEAKKLRQRLLQICLLVEPFSRGGTDWETIETKFAEAQERWEEIGPVPGDKQLQDRFANARKEYLKRRETHERDQRLRAEEARRVDEKRKRDAEEAAAKARAEAEAGVKADEERVRREALEAQRQAAREEAKRTEVVRSVEDELAALCARAERLLERERLLPDRVDELEARWRELDPEAPAADAALAPPAAEAALAPPAAVEPPAPVATVEAPVPPPPVLPADTATASVSAVDAGWDDEPSQTTGTTVPAAPAPAETPVAAPVAAAPVAAPVDVAAAAPAAEHPRAAARRRFFSALVVARTRAAEAAAKTQAERAELLTEITRGCERLERLAESNDAKKVEAAIKQARAALKGSRPSGDPAEAELLARYAKAIDVLVTRAASLREAEGWRRWANLPKFEELIKEAETLAEVIDTVEDKRHAPAVLKDLQARWREAGTLPQEKSQQLWDRFKKACDSVHEKTREYFAKLDGDRPENLKKKELLCEKVEALRESTDWKATSETIKALQDEWKTIGPVPDEQREEIWKRFRGACDVFFERRNENDKSRDEERAGNLQRKQELCVLAEELSASTDWRATADRIKDLQEEWKTVGPVPRTAGDDLWKRFRSACDRFFDARKAAFEVQDSERTVNLEKKTALCVQAEALAELDDQDAAIEQVKQLQAEWKRIGHVPRELSDALWTRFRGACDRVFEGPNVDELLQPEDKERLGIGGFVNRLPLGDFAAKLAAAAPAAPTPTAAPAEPQAAAEPQAPAPAPAPAPTAEPAGDKQPD